MATNRLVLRKCAAPCVAGVFVALFSVGASGQDESCFVSNTDWAVCGEFDPEFKGFYSDADVAASDVSVVPSIWLPSPWVPSPTERLTPG